jgi:hypothetical protein
MLGIVDARVNPVLTFTESGIQKRIIIEVSEIP